MVLSTSQRQKRDGDQASLAKKLIPTCLLALIAIVLLVYPVVVTQLNNWEQMRVAAQYTRSIDGANTSELEERYTSAQVYNSNHSDGPILDPWLNRISEDNTDYQNYLAELDTHDVMARLVIPGIKVDLPVYHGTSEKTLQKGVGHLYGSDLPVGGQGTHAVLTAHTGLTNATLFDNLDDVVKGDAIYLGVSGEKLKYVVDDIRVVLPHETNTLRPEAGKDQITLITCTPYGINSHSLLVTAQRVPMDSTEEEVFQTSGLQWAWWMWAMLAGALLIGILLFLWVRKTTKRHNDKLRSLADLKDGA